MAWTLIIRSVLIIVKKGHITIKKRIMNLILGFPRAAICRRQVGTLVWYLFVFLAPPYRKLNYMRPKYAASNIDDVCVVRAWFRAYYFSILVNIIFFSTATRTYLVHLQFVWGSFTNNSTGREGWKSSKNWVCGWALSSNCSVCHLFYNAKFKILIS